MINETKSSNAAQHFETQLGNYQDNLSEISALPEHWQKFVSAINNVGVTELNNRRHEINRLLNESGVTYTIYNDTGESNQLWKLDPIPFLIQESEWQQVEYGIQQRAKCLNLVLHDLYGPQTLLKNGYLPSELIFSHSGFLTPCVDSIRSGNELTLYACDLTRGPYGGFWVLNDHTQAPSGIGYSLENRSVISRVMADLYHGNPVQRLDSFTLSLQKGLMQSANYNTSDPHIVILTPGALNETYFEHAYMAAQLGYTLAQGDDLTIRDGKVWLRTLKGLKGVDVLLRRIDDRYCDPLELFEQSRLGTAGLLHAVRRGNVSIANALGSGILENPGLLAFLPGICRFFLGEDLVLPSVASWWCGQKKERNFVLTNLNKLAIKTLERGSRSRTIFGHLLNSAETEALKQRIVAQPWRYVGQEQITFSTAPTLNHTSIETRNTIIRGFAVACDETYDIMPGGLTRAAGSTGQLAVSNQAGALSKDTWVLSNKPLPIRTETSNRPPANTVAITEPLSSRAAENLFWVGRHFERIINCTRLLRTVLYKQSTLLSDFDQNCHYCLMTLLRALTHVSSTYPGFVDTPPGTIEQQQQEILSLCKNSNRNGSLASNIRSFYQSAHNIRNLWSQDTWRCIDGIHSEWFSQLVNVNSPGLQLPHQLSGLSNRLAAFSGLSAESMTRESGWLLLQIGRKIEHALCLIALLRAMTVSRHTDLQLTTLLDMLLMTTDSFNIYQRRYRTTIRLPQTLELLLLDRTHPHSLLFQLQGLHQQIKKLPKSRLKNRLTGEQRLILQAYSNLQLVEINKLLQSEDNSIYNQLEFTLSETARLLWELAESINLRYFTHIQPFMQLSPTGTDHSR